MKQLMQSWIDILKTVQSNCVNCGGIGYSPVEHLPGDWHDEPCTCCSPATFVMEQMESAMAKMNDAESANATLRDLLRRCLPIVQDARASIWYSSDLNLVNKLVALANDIEAALAEKGN